MALSFYGEQMARKQAELLRDFKKDALALRMRVELKERYGLDATVTKVVPASHSEGWVFAIEWWDGPSRGVGYAHVEGRELEEVLAGVLWLAVRVVVGPRQASFQNGALV